MMQRTARPPNPVHREQRYNATTPPRHPSVVIGLPTPVAAANRACWSETGWVFCLHRKAWNCWNDVEVKGRRRGMGLADGGCR